MPEASIADLLAGSLAPPPPPVLPPHLQQYVDSAPPEQRDAYLKAALASLAGPEPAPPVTVTTVELVPPNAVAVTPGAAPLPVIPAPVVTALAPPPPVVEPPKRKRGRPPQSTTLQIILAGLTGGQTLDTIKAAIELAGENEAT